MLAWREIEDLQNPISISPEIDHYVICSHNPALAVQGFYFLWRISRPGSIAVP